MAYASLHDRLRGPVAEKLHAELHVKNHHALPRIEAVIVNVGINKSKMDSKEMQEYIAESLMKITGQKPVFRPARKAIANFKTRKGVIVGAQVTLRGKRMEAFLDRLLSYALPRIRDFRGVTPRLDGHGNYALGIRDHTIFPEVPSVEAGKIFGFQVQLKTTAKRDDVARAMLKAVGMPFQPERRHVTTAAAKGQKPRARGSLSMERAAVKESPKESSTPPPAISASQSQP